MDETKQPDSDKTRKHPKSTLASGDVLVVPFSEWLVEPAYGLAVVYESDGWSTATLWMFGPLLADVPTFDEAVELTHPELRLFPCVTGAQAISLRGWPVLGTYPGFSLDSWPEPTWGSINMGKGALWKYDFPSRKKAVQIYEETTPEHALSYPPFISRQVGSAEITLARHLITGSNPDLLHGQERSEAWEKYRRIEAPKFSTMWR